QKAPEASVQQGFHLVSFGQDENLVISFHVFPVISLVGFCAVACGLQDTTRNVAITRADK
uniref:hypothetical protein n=1 Tax=Chryseobacterium lactis TaxID=1241981 RepID=UPI001C8A933E